MNPNHETAAICGLFCGTCPSYPGECGGCLSTRVAPGCDDCGSGFRDCADEHSVTRCFECGGFPCARLEAFRQKHIINGICHHARVIDDLRRMKEIGVEAWVDFALVNLVQPGDVVVTQDYGLAAMCLARGVRILNQDGMEYISDNIDALLLARHTAKKIRTSGGRLKGPPKRIPQQDKSFQLALVQLLAEACP